METDQRQFRLIVLQGPHPNEIFRLSEQEITVGRETQNNIVISDPEVSRKHALLRRIGRGYTIEDLGSTNGTFVNGARIARAVPLADGDRVSLGETIQLAYQEQTPARDQTVVAPVGAVTPALSESDVLAEPVGEIGTPAEPPVSEIPPSPLSSVDAPERYQAEVLEPPPPFGKPIPSDSAENEPGVSEEPAPPRAPEPPVEVKRDVPLASPPSFEPVRPARYEAERPIPSVVPPAYERSRLPAQEPGPPITSPEPPSRQLHRQEPPSPPPYYEEYEEVPQPRPRRRRNLLIGCGCLLLLFACAAVIGFAYLIWNAPYEFFQDPIRNFGRLFEILTLVLTVP